MSEKGKCIIMIIYADYFTKLVLKLKGVVDSKVPFQSVCRICIWGPVREICKASNA